MKRQEIAYWAAAIIASLVIGLGTYAIVEGLSHREACAVELRPSYDSKAVGEIIRAAV